MSVLVFGELVRLPWTAVAAAAAAAGLVLAGLMAAALNERFSPDVLLGGWGGRVWAAASWAACFLLVAAAVRPVWPAKVFGVLYWPARLEGWAAWNHLLTAAALGAAAFFVAGVLAGRLDAWRPAAPTAGSGARLAWGAACGAVLGAAGLAAGRALFIGDALGRLGFALTGSALLWGAPAALAATGAAAVWAAAGSSWERRWRLGALAAALVLWLVPLAGVEAVLRAGWDFGRRGLAEAAGVAKAGSAERRAVLVLADADGRPGTQRREDVLSAEGMAVSRQGLEAVRRYLEAQGYRTIFLKEALGYLRKGWARLWEPERAMDAMLVRLGPRFPPDYEGFLKAILAAPATPDNYGRLENLARAADTARMPSVNKAGQLFQGVSDAYARFGDLENSNLWLGRIRKLWPLYDGDVNVDPITEEHEGLVAGAVTFNGRPASAVQVGLFMQLSTAAVPSAQGGLVAAAWPDADGRFVFRDLTPGRYYLALRADPILLGDERLRALFAPGVFRLTPDAMERELFPIALERGPAPPSFLPPPLPDSGAVSLPVPL